MANGLIEKVNETRKKMLIRLCSEQPRYWDGYLEPLPLAEYRETPQEITHFSFELLYGWTA